MPTTVKKKTSMTTASATLWTPTDPWIAWNGTSACTTALTWENWNVSTATTVTVSNVWPAWIGTQTYTQNARDQVRAHFLPRAQPRAQIQGGEGPLVRTNAEWEALQAKENAEYVAKKAARDAAFARAELLLMGVLKPEQQKTLTEKGWFVVIGKSGKRYRIDRGQHGNVRLIDDTGRVMKRYCAQPADKDGELPDPDAMLAQKLFLEHCEDRFLAVANAS